MKHFATSALALLPLVMSNAMAHHATNLGYDVDKRITVEGELVEMKWINPHVIMQFNVVNAKGQKELWTAETHSTAVLTRFGWRKNMLHPGQKITLFGQPGRKDPHAMHVLSVTAEGKTYKANTGDS